MSTYITLPLELGLRVKTILEKEHSISAREDNMGMLSLEFTQEELNLITELKIQNPVSKSLIGLEHLHNLQTLEVETQGVVAYKFPKNTPSLDDKDISEIAKLEGLKKLVIKNQANSIYG